MTEEEMHTLARQYAEDHLDDEWKSGTVKSCEDVLFAMFKAGIPPEEADRLVGKLIGMVKSNYGD